MELDYYSVPGVYDETKIVMLNWRLQEVIGLFKDQNKLFECIIGSTNPKYSKYDLVRRSTQVERIALLEQNKDYWQVWTESGREYLLPKSGETGSDSVFDNMVRDFTSKFDQSEMEYRFVPVEEWIAKKARTNADRSADRSADIKKDDTE